MPQLKTPAIVHWNLNHFVVLSRATGKAAVTHDRALGVRHLSYAEVSREFTGNALQLERAIDFTPADERREVSVKALIGTLDGWRQSFAFPSAIALTLELITLAAPRVSQFMIANVLMSNDTSLHNAGQHSPLVPENTYPPRRHSPPTSAGAACSTSRASRRSSWRT
ncbi:cysteine peptidase family C39 domain-containing protein [Massilia violaceinigra]|uniref:cysteine peptidase family C39 domain-containing protein n=1 Tax=Massilia violaceinigra TaxID=2045208 RepID=UPI00351D5EA6